jgi:hypothetical protein
MLYNADVLRSPNASILGPGFSWVLLSQSLCFRIEQNENSSLHRILNQPWIAGIEGHKVHPSYAGAIL